ncbi:hypothetical protein [Subtercola vilae]|uniref:hypothetical protein n=1 Tax=Subtercola vilae TaxID=2056433 RepID=UPI001F37FB29|nr:hypothetical protein [Subtercola vilae]
MIKGPADNDCWLWVGAVSDDGYGRFWVQRGGKQRAVRPQRYSYELLTGLALPRDVLLLHDCDIPLCVHADIDLARSHVWEGDHRKNMLDREQKGRTVNGATAWRWRGLPRALRAERSRALRQTVLEHGWDPALMSAALSGTDPEHPRLF